MRFVRPDEITPPVDLAFVTPVHGADGLVCQTTDTRCEIAGSAGHPRSMRSGANQTRRSTDTWNAHMPQKPIVAIIDDSQTNGHALRVLDNTNTPKYLIPLRHGRIHYAEPLNAHEIVIAAYPASDMDHGFLAVVDSQSGLITRQSAPLPIGGYSQFFITDDSKTIISSNGSGFSFAHWRSDTLELGGKYNMIRRHGDDISFDDRDKYFTLVVSDRDNPRHFHSEELKQLYDSQITSKQLEHFHEARPIIGQLNDGSVVLPVFKRVRVTDASMPLGWREEIEDDGFLLVDLKSWRATPAHSHGPIAKPVSKKAHSHIFDDDQFDGMKVATIQITIKNNEPNCFVAAILSIGDEINQLGVDRLGLGNSLTVSFLMDDTLISEQEFVELFRFAKESEELSQSIKYTLNSYSNSVDNMSRDTSPAYQLYAGDESSGIPALSFLVSLYLKLTPKCLAPARRFVSQLDTDHCNDDFLCIGTRYYGIGKEALRAVVMSHLYRWNQHDWNDDRVLEVAWQHHSPEFFCAIVREELEERSADLANLGWSSERIETDLALRRRWLLASLRDHFDLGVRTLIGETG